MPPEVFGIRENLHPRVHEAASLQREAEKRLELRGGDGDGGRRGEAADDGLGDEVDEETCE